MSVLHKKTRKKEKKDTKEKKGEKQFIHSFHQNDLFAQYRTERSPVNTGDLKIVSFFFLMLNRYF